MKYDVMETYKQYLETMFTSDTVRIYYNRLDTLLQNQSFKDIKNQLDTKQVLENFSNIKYKNHFSQSKNAFLYFCSFQNIALDTDFFIKLRLLENKTRKKYRKRHEIDFNAIYKTINRIKNKKLRLSYQTIIATGLRVFELAQIKVFDCSISDNTITFNFVGKGSKNQQTILHKTDYPRLYENLKNHIENTRIDKKVFYSAIYLQTNAKRLGFKCHDLRRAFAKIEYKNNKSKLIVKEKLRHTSIKSTNIYLRSKVHI